MYRVDRIVVPALIALALTGTARAQDRPAAPGAEGSPASPGPAVVEADGERYITMDFQDVDLGILVKFMGEITGKNFVMDERVQGKVTVVSPTKITPDEAYQVFQAVLQVKGFTTVPSGAVTRIIPTKDAKVTSLPTLTDGAGRTPAEAYVTRLIPLRDVDVADIIPVLQPLVSPDGLLSGYGQTNKLIVIDSAANVARIGGIVQELDVATSRRHTELIPVKYAAAADLADTIQQVLEERPVAPGQPQPPRPPIGSAQLRFFKLTPDDRTNSLIVSAPAEQMRQIKTLVEQLDVPLPPGSGRINVYYLKYANAEDLLPILLDVIGASGAGGRVQRPPQQPGAPGTASTARRNRRARGSSLSRASGERLRRPGAPGQPAGGQTGQQQPIEFAGDIRITADPATNALIIAAAPEDYAILLGVIDKLDIHRRQVYVEAIIMEVTLDRTRQLGIELQGATLLDVANQDVGFGRTNLGNLNTALTNPGILSGLVLGALSGQTVELPDGTKIPAQAALLTALQTESDINILSAPNILTTDNEEAEIVVGQNVPFVASRSTSETNLSNTFSTIEREDVGITLQLTPQISEGSIVRLALFEEVSAIIPNPLLDANEVGPTTTVRSASTTITVKDGQTVVIGGLISDSNQATESKAPFLADIPVLGNLFKNTSATKNKINLLIFLTPHIIKDEFDAADMSVSERDRFRDQMRGSRTPPRHPDPLLAPSFELPEDREVPPPGGEEDVPAPPSAEATSGRELAFGTISINRQADGATVLLQIGGPPTRVSHYALAEPGRYVIDIYGASQAAPEVQSIRVLDPLVRRVRVANHHGRMRIVLDLTVANPPGYELETHGGTIALKLGAARAVRTSAAQP